MQIWLPDTRAPGFAEECARQSRLVSTAEGDPDHDAWSDMKDTSGWTA